MDHAPTLDMIDTACPPATGTAHAALAPVLADPSVVTTWLASPRLARAWAEVVVMHWSRIERLGGLDLSQPLYLLDFAPADGRLPALLLAALEQEMAGRGMLGWPLRYLLCPLPGAPSAAGLLQSPDLQAHAARGWLDTASWQARTGHPILLGSERFPLFGMRNPVVALCAGGLSALPAQCWSTHHGSLLQAQLRLDDGPGDTLGITCEWQPWPSDTPMTDPVLSPLLEHYRVALPCGPVLLCEQALSLLDALVDLSAGRYLLLAADVGVCSESQARLGAFGLPERAAPGGLHLPVNFHALALHQLRCGSRAENLQGASGALVLHLACRDERIGVDAAAWDALCARAGAAHPDARGWLLGEGSDDPAEDLAQRLRASEHDPCLLARWLDALQDGGPPDLPPCGQAAQAALRGALATAWRQLPGDERSAARCAALAALLFQLSDWRLAREVLDGVPADAAPLLGLQRAHLALATGALPAARLALQEHLRRCPDDDDASELADLLCARDAWRRDHPWHGGGGQPGDGELSLEPLDAYHVGAWLHQMRDPHVAEIAGLPALQDPADCHAYLQAAEAQAGAEYAVMHRDLGLLGGIGLRCLDGAAHLHFWIGVDHQGRGWGGRALALLMQTMQAQGIRDVFASVWQGNVRSCRMLERVGFARMAHEGRGEDAGYLFLHRALHGPPATAQVLQARLAALCASIGEPLLGPAIPDEHTTDRS